MTRSEHIGCSFSALDEGSDLFLDATITDLQFCMRSNPPDS